MTTTVAPSDLAILYRFAVALVGVNPMAEQMVHEALEEKLGRLAMGDSVEDSRKNLLELLSTLWRQRPIPKNDEPMSHLPAIFQWVPVEDRGVYSLRALGDFSEQEITAVCGTHAIRGNVIPQEKIAQALENVPVSPELLRRLAATAKAAHPPFRLWSPLGLAVTFAGLALLLVGAWIMRDWSHHANETLAAKFIAAAENTPASTLEAVDLPLSELSEILFLRHGLENYPLPEDFLQKRVALLGIGFVEGHKIVQIGLKDSHALLMLFRAEDFGLDPDDSTWRTADADGWSVALRTRHGQGHALAFYGSPDALQPLLE